jgi:cytochrome c peroxidase
MVNRATVFILTSVLALGCSANDDDPSGDEQTAQATDEAVSVDQFLHGGGGSKAADIAKGFLNFTLPIPGGNGRACATCHVPLKDFTISPAEVERQYQKNSKGPLFRSIDADDFANDFTTVREKALFRVTIPLPPNVSIVGSSAREVKIFRAVPTVFNVKLTTPYTHDGRELNLFGQARGAAGEHSRPASLPNDAFFDKIVTFQEAMFSSAAVKGVADAIDDGEAPPPVGQDYGQPLNALEQQGFAAFQEHCIVCHGGNARNQINTFAFPSGFFTAFVSERNRAGLEALSYDVTENGVTTRTPPSPDPGRMLITGKRADFNFFDVTQLRGVSRTAPYFHDNSSPDLTDVLNHYNVFFQAFGIPTIRPDQFAPLLAYLNRL